MRAYIIFRSFLLSLDPLPGRESDGRRAIMTGGKLVPPAKKRKKEKERKREREIER